MKMPNSIHVTVNLSQQRVLDSGKGRVRFLADRTNGRAYATVLRLSSSSVCRLSVMLCIVTKRRVLQQKLLLTAYRKSYK